jgi:hypothetical protein
MKLETPSQEIYTERTKHTFKLNIRKKVKVHETLMCKPP